MMGGLGSSNLETDFKFLSIIICFFAAFLLNKCIFSLLNQIYLLNEIKKLLSNQNTVEPT